MTSPDPLDAVTVTPKTGDEPFTRAGRPLDGARLRGFWSWSCSDLIGNAMRGVLAEYIVGLALGCVDGGTRREWDAADLVTGTGLRVEVKSAAYVQSWKQTRLSTIAFDIRPTAGWDFATNTYATERKRQADVYVFCVFTPTDKATADPLDVDQWDFYVMSTDRLNMVAGGQKSISLAGLLRHRPVRCSFDGLAGCVGDVG
ncbi:hypothetical protein [Actinokineospora sp. UTMC 2448]|uniref:hypothetical protein n=1 Tax=Actinokineospora sp. UTMC 2448 TaxID=2268449 RepID=UPI002164EEDD|nr:hypothetical protein [Actinokineospora sp. UTMC 2448]UVS80359.1 hypothetical protein Actkin_04110 [Actinokineospora sp. UTMC 2448]